MFSFVATLEFGRYNAHTTMKVFLAKPVPEKVVFHTEYLNTYFDGTLNGFNALSSEVTADNNTYIT